MGIHFFRMDLLRCLHRFTVVNHLSFSIDKNIRDPGVLKLAVLCAKGLHKPVKELQRGKIFLDHIAAFEDGIRRIIVNPRRFSENLTDFIRIVLLAGKIQCHSDLGALIQFFCRTD